ncbi:ribonucleotide reductase (IA) alpha subunit [Edwardsiella phage vB_EtaM_ET-ABTNL-9]|nr:ribonucleotide reductase (IA) alpha subunit [Edwardsiella phage vB_EtaM_ET-ABTNL-9]
MTQRDFSSERKELQSKGLAPKWFTTMGWQLFSQKYLNGDSKTPKDQYQRIAKTLAKQAPKEYPDWWDSNEYFAGKTWEQAFFDIMWDGFLSPSTPLLTNTGTDYGMSVSCSGAYVPDSVLGFYNTRKQNALLTKEGFGTSAYIGDVRPRGSKMKNGEASGAQPVARMFVTDSMDISQGSNRRGAVSWYYPIDGEDFNELVHYLETFTDGNNAGWCITDDFRDKLLAGDKEAVKRWGQMLSCKGNVGSGYQFFVDKVNRANPPMYKDKGLKVKASNLCSEITLFSDEENTFTCVLSSENLRYWDTRPDNLAFVGTVFLDCVVSDFVESAKGVEGLEQAVKFTEESRALGYGAMAFHTYLLDNNIVWGSLESQYINELMFSTIKKEAKEATKWLAKVMGEPELCKGYGVRNTHLLAVAPTKSTALIVGSVSEGINPQVGFVFTQATPAGEVVRIDPSFLDLLKKKGLYGDEHNKKTTDLLNDINAHKGSIQHRPEFTDEEKAVFRTAFEINPYDHLKMVSARQEYICQSQSTNLFLANTSAKDMSKIYLYALLDKNIKSLYYNYGIRDANIQTNSVCSACE